MRATVVVLALLFAALGAWMLLRPSPAPEDPDAPGRAADATGEGPRPAPSPGLPTAPSASAPSAPGPSEAGRPPPDAQRGDLVVVPRAPEGGSVPEDLRMTLEYVGERLGAAPLAVDEGGGRHRYRAIPAGEYRLRLFSDRTLDAVVAARVRANVEETVEVPLVAGGYAEVKVTYLDGEPPAKVTLALKDETGAPATARFEGRGKAATSPRTGSVVTMPADVVVSALRPGRYVLRATSGDEFDEQAFEVRAGEGATVAMKVRR
jgi:hypothetical protein